MSDSQRTSFPSLSCNVGAIERAVSAAAGAALIAGGLRRRGPGGAIAAFLGGALLFRGATGHCPVKAALAQGEPGSGQAESAVLEHGDGFDVEESIIVRRSAQDLYDFWRNVENLPLFMDSLHSVTPIDATRSVWVAEGPAGRRVTWEAEIINEEPHDRIGWRSLPGSEVTHAGSVQFFPTGDATEVRVHLRYDPPLGRAGKLVAKLFRKAPDQQIGAELERFREMMETSEKAGT